MKHWWMAFFARYFSPSRVHIGNSVHLQRQRCKQKPKSLIFFAALLTSTNAKTVPVMVASQTGSQGISWWTMAALSTGAIAPLIVIGVFLERYIVKGLTAGAVK